MEKYLRSKHVKYSVHVHTFTALNYKGTNHIVSDMTNGIQYSDLIPLLQLRGHRMHDTDANLVTNGNQDAEHQEPFQHIQWIQDTGHLNRSGESDSPCVTSISRFLGGECS